MPRILPAVMSLLVPGLGQLARRQIGSAALFLWAGLWLHVLLAGTALAQLGAGPPPPDALQTWLFGAFGAERGLHSPRLVVTTVLCAVVHGWSAYSAWEQPPPATPRQTSAGEAA